MKKYILIQIWLVVFSISASAQAVVSDPVHTGITTLIKLFQDPSFKTIVKDIESLKKIAGAVQQFHRGTEIVQIIGKCNQKLSTLSTAVSMDGHIYPAEYQRMLQDITEISKQGTSILKDMKSATTQAGSVLKMTDGERVKWLNDTYSRVKSFERMINSYFSKIQVLSMRRSGNKNDLSSTAKLYKIANLSTTGFSSTGGNGSITGTGYDGAYTNDTTSVLDNAYKTEQAKQIKEMQLNCSRRMQNYYDEKSIAESEMERDAFQSLMSKGWNYKVKTPKFTLQSVLSFNVFTAVSGVVDAANNGQNLQSNSGGGGTESIQSSIEDGISSFIDPNGKIVSNEQFLIYLRIEARELMAINKVDEKLREKWKLDECNTLGLY